jgi:predicted metal-dependent phosphoesterase TrpH
MNIDLHVHSRLSKSFDYNPDDMARVIKVARQRGLEGIALTEHIHAVGFWRMHERLARHAQYAHGVYDVGGFPVLSGAEITVREHVDFIVLGPLDALRALDAAFRPRLSEWNLVSAHELVEVSRPLDLITILAHPFREGKEAAHLAPCIYRGIDAVEFNARDYDSKRRTKELARRHQLPLTGGSDAHCFMQVGIGCTVTPHPVTSHVDLRRALRAGIGVESKPYAPTIVTLCKAIKRAAKQQRSAPTGDCNVERHADA